MYPTPRLEKVILSLDYVCMPFLGSPTYGDLPTYILPDKFKLSYTDYFKFVFQVCKPRNQTTSGDLMFMGQVSLLKNMSLVDPFSAEFSLTLSWTHAKARISRVQLKDWQWDFCNSCPMMKGMMNGRIIFVGGRFESVWCKWRWHRSVLDNSWVNEGCLIGKTRYPKLSVLVEGMLTVLHSNTDVEQLFS